MHQNLLRQPRRRKLRTQRPALPCKLSGYGFSLGLGILGALIALIDFTLPAIAVPLAVANGGGLQQAFRDALTWVASLGPIGPLAFMGIYILATVGFLPGSILTLGAGVIFGWVQGSLYVFIGATLGATAAFLVGRYLARGWVSGKIAGNPKFAAIDNAVGNEGFKIVLLTRLSPVFPFNLLNYMFGITKVSLKDYVLGSIGMIPGTLMYVYIGSLAGNLALIGSSSQPSDERLQWILRIVGFVATVAVTLYVTRVARKALSEKIVEPEA